VEWPLYTALGALLTLGVGTLLARLGEARA
jgi:hypothetical protein